MMGRRIITLLALFLLAGGLHSPFAKPDQQAVPATPYRIGIFPCGGEFGSVSLGGVEQRVARVLQTNIEENHALLLAYSYYDKVLNEPRIKNRDRLWVGGEVKKKPNAEVVYRLARERGLDGVVMCWARRPGNAYTDSYALELYLIEVERRRVYRQKGTTKKSDVNKRIRKVVAQFLAGHPQATQARAEKPAQPATAKRSPARAGTLHEAAAKGNLTEVERLIAGGARVKAKDKDGNTPLHNAVINGHVTVAALLIAEGAKVKARNKAGYTPLHAAAYQGEKAVAELLIIKGAKVNAKDKYGQTPLTLAESKGHMNIVELLRQHGTEGSEITPKKVRLVLNAPGLEDAHVTFELQPSIAYGGISEGGTVQMGQWQAHGSRWPRAWLLLQNLYTGFVFHEGPSLVEIMLESFPDSAIDIGEKGRLTNRMGKVEYQRFTVRVEENISCVAVSQYTRLRVPDPGFLLSAIEDTHIFGWYCDALLSDETVTRFIKGIGVKGYPK